MILIGHAGGYNAILYSLNGDTLVSGSAQGNIIRLWDVASGQCRAVIRDIRGDFQGTLGLTRGINSEDFFVTTDSNQGSVVWKIVDEGDQCYLSPRLAGANGALEVTGMSMQDVRGLSQPNKQLLRQRGAVGDPEMQLREVGKKVTAMASVMSKLKQPAKQAALGIPLASETH